jgi:hypothetical protein
VDLLGLGSSRRFLKKKSLPSLSSSSGLIFTHPGVIILNSISI